MNFNNLNLWDNSEELETLTPKIIKEIRAMFGFTQVKFAELIGVKYDTYRNWEIGHRSPSSPASSLLRIARRHPDIFIEYARKSYQ
jgi:putative transcriptional regulator